MDCVLTRQMKKGAASVEDADSPMFSMEIAVDPSLAEFVPAALARLGYLFPAIAFAAADGRILITGKGLDETSLRREILHALYRERILERTLPLRQALIEGLLAR